MVTFLSYLAVYFLGAFSLLALLCITLMRDSKNREKAYKVFYTEAPPAESDTILNYEGAVHSH
jgi:hypothetical protein